MFKAYNANVTKFIRKVKCEECVVNLVSFVQDKCNIAFRGISYFLVVLMVLHVFSFKVPVAMVTVSSSVEINDTVYILQGAGGDDYYVWGRSSQNFHLDSRTGLIKHTRTQFLLVTPANVHCEGKRCVLPVCFCQKQYMNTSDAM